MQAIETSSIRMVFEFGRWILRCEYNDRHIPKAAHFWWDRKIQAWVTSSARVASGLILYADKEAKERILDKLTGPPGEQREYSPAKVGRFGNHS